MFLTTTRICRHIETGELVQLVGYAYNPNEKQRDRFHYALFIDSSGALQAYEIVGFENWYEAAAQFKRPEM